jgi:hypothetical protein
VTYKNRGATYAEMDNRVAAIADFQRYLDLGGGRKDGEQAEVEQAILDLKANKPLQSFWRKGEAPA